MNSKATFLFDFDGVMMDSHPETMVSAYNSVTNELLTKISDLPSLFVEYFEMNRCRAKSAGEIYLLAFWAIEEIKTNPDSKVKFLTREEFAEILKKISKPNLDYGEIFFAQRNKFMREHRTDWLNLFQPYQPLWDVLLNQVKPIIITYKNRAAVNELCQYYKLILNDDFVYTGDNSTGKVENIIAMHQKFNSDQYIFIDDAVRNLIFLKENLPNNINVELCYATWGYGAEDDLDLARENGFICYSQEAFVQKLML